MSREIRRASDEQLKQYEQIGQRIKLLRKRSKLNQKELARCIGASSASAIHYIEKAKRYIKVLDLIAIAKVLGVSMDTLLLGESVLSEWSYPVGRAPQKLSEPKGNPITPVNANCPL